MKKKSAVKTQYGVFDITLSPESEKKIKGYVVTVPKVRGVVTWGKTLVHARKMAKEAIECAIEGEILIAAERQGRIAFLKHRAVA